MKKMLQWGYNEKEWLYLKEKLKIGGSEQTFKKKMGTS